MSETVSGPVSRGFKPYPEYRDSGVEWLGGIPAHWEVKRTKHIFRVINGSTPKSSEPEYWDGNIAWVTPDDLGSLFKPEIIETARRISIDGYRSCGTTLVPPNSLVLSTRAPIGHLAIAGTELCTNQGCRCLVSHNEISSRFYYYMILAAKQELESLGQGSTFNELGKQELEFVSLPFPSLSEQRAIADFLDRETARIDALIERKQRLTELLQEKRSVLISQAVTKGLDPGVPMKDSGVEWLGEIPEHWKVKCLRNLGGAIIGLTYAPADIVGPDEESTLVLRASNVSHGNIILEDNVFVGCLVPDNLITRLNDILICSRSGSRALIGKSAKITRDLVGVTFGAFMTVFRSPYNDYLYWVLNSTLFDYQSAACLTSTINQLTLGNLKGISVPFPSNSERLAITSFLDRETARIDALVAKTEESIAKLSEYRMALISAAVTGKIDVREST